MSGFQRLDLGLIHAGRGGTCFQGHELEGTPKGLVAAYTANAAHFDGTNDYLNRGADLTGMADGKTGTVSMWMKFTTDTVNVTLFRNDITRFLVDWLSADVGQDDKFRVFGRNTANTTILTMRSNTAYTSASGWLHVLSSWDLSTTTGLLYINDADDLAASPTLTDDSIDYTGADWGVGANSTGTNKLDGDMADLWFDDSFIDISVEANRRKFIDATGKPVSLGADGSTPTGSQPLVFLSGPTVDWHTNLGTGGGFTENGALTDGGSSPSD